MYKMRRNIQKRILRSLNGATDLNDIQISVSSFTLNNVRFEMQGLSK